MRILHVDTIVGLLLATWRLELKVTVATQAGWNVLCLRIKKETGLFKKKV